MKVAFVSTVLHYPWGGADTLWTHAAEAAAKGGDSLFISVSPTVAASPRIAALRAAGAVLLERTPPIGPPAFTARLAARFTGLLGTRPEPLVAALAAFRPDLVIFSLGGTYDLALHPALFDWLRDSGTKFRVIANWQQDNPVLGDSARALAREILAAADSVNFVSTRNLEVTRRHLLHPLSTARVIQNPLRWRPSDVSPWPAATGLRIATVSRLDENKGIQLLLHASAQVLARERNWQINIFGQGPAEDYLRSVVQHLSLGGSVNFRGQVRELRAIWEENHLLVSSSIDDGVPMTIPEAMLCQRPVLATCVGGAEDWLSNGQTGFLCPAPTLPLLAATLGKACAERGRWEAMGRAAATTAQAHYRPDDYLQLITPC